MLDVVVTNNLFVEIFQIWLNYLQLYFLHIICYTCRHFPWSNNNHNNHNNNNNDHFAGWFWRGGDKEERDLGNLSRWQSLAWALEEERGGLPTMRSRPLWTSFSTLPGGTRSNRKTTPTLTFYLTTLRLSRLGGTMRDTTTSYFSSPAFSTAYPNLFKVSAENFRTITSSGASSPICLTSEFSTINTSTDGSFALQRDCSIFWNLIFIFWKRG